VLLGVLITASEPLALARELQAPRCIRLVEDLSPAFKPYATADGVPELVAQLRTA
jgi:hypothetical protein